MTEVPAVGGLFHFSYFLGLLPFLFFSFFLFCFICFYIFLFNILNFFGVTFKPRGATPSGYPPSVTASRVAQQTIYSQFLPVVIKTKNRNRSMNNVKNLGYDR